MHRGAFTDNSRVVSSTKGVNQRRTLLLLAGLVAFVTAFNVWAIAVDHRLSGCDSYCYQALMLERFLDGEPGSFQDSLDSRGPLVTLLAVLFLKLVGSAPLGLRLLSVLGHSVLMIQAYGLTRAMGGARLAGLFATLICGVHPMIFGWARLAYHETLLSVAVLAVLHLAYTSGLDRLRPALKLGLALGLGLLTKLTFILLMVAPAIWAITQGIRRRRISALPVLLIAGITGGAAALWAAKWGGEFVGYVQMSTHTSESALGKLAAYLALPGSWVLLAGALVTAVTLWWLREAERPALVLLTSTVVFSFGLIAVAFDRSSRYVVPVYPVAALLAGMGLAWAVEQLPRRARQLAAALVSAALLTMFVSLNLTGVPTEVLRREVHAGLITPDRSHYNAYPKAVSALVRHKLNMLITVDSPEAIATVEGVDLIWYRRGYRPHPLDLPAAKAALAKGRPVGVLLIRRYASEPLTAAFVQRFWPVDPQLKIIFGEEGERMHWLVRQRRRKLFAARDPDGMLYVAYRVEPPRSP